MGVKVKSVMLSGFEGRVFITWEEEIYLLGSSAAWYTACLSLGAIPAFTSFPIVKVALRPLRT